MFTLQCITGGKFKCACVYPLNDANAIAGVKMAREIRMFLVVCVCFLIQANFAAYKYVVCGKNVKGKSDARCDALYRSEFQSCFGISDSPGAKICGRCRNVVTEFRRKNLYKCKYDYFVIRTMRFKSNR